ncbi:MAG: hypothetical protein MHPSP_001260, partial [Paramarteilia canceri]
IKEPEIDSEKESWRCDQCFFNNGLLRPPTSIRSQLERINKKAFKKSKYLTNKISILKSLDRIAKAECFLCRNLLTPPKRKKGFTNTSKTPNHSKKREEKSSSSQKKSVKKISKEMKEAMESNSSHSSSDFISVRLCCFHSLTEAMGSCASYCGDEEDQCCPCLTNCFGKLACCCPGNEASEENGGEDETANTNPIQQTN